MTQKYAGKAKAPEFPDGAEWLNSNGLLRLEDFSGKLLLLDFWTSCCINCMHLIPVLRRLERQFADELAVVGIHTPKFDAEHATEHVRQAIVRYGVSHPVINDASLEMWRRYGVRAWPTLVCVDPTARVVGKIEGELTFEQGAALIEEMLSEYRSVGILRPRSALHSVETMPQGLLSYPGKVLADVQGDRLFIADSGHHRVLVTDFDGTIQTVVGSGNEGSADGVLEGSQFRRPQGLALFGEALYIADTGNHTIRVADLESATVGTVAGSGSPGSGRADGGPALTVNLRSPWDLVQIGRRLYIAMAGSHQIWMYDLDSGLVQAVVGTGAEDITDGPPEEAALAQPSGIDADADGVLFFVDSETSSVRQADLITSHQVSTLVGSGLFEFGDADGEASVARLQHPQGIAVEGGIIYVADTYNNKIKRIGTETLTARTITGNGKRGLIDGAFEEARFDQPGGLAIAGDQIYVADTNNNRIRVLDVRSETVRTLPVDF